VARVSKEIERNIGNLFLYDKAGHTRVAIVAAGRQHPWQHAGTLLPEFVLAAESWLDSASCSCWLSIADI
jgi:hypothetical protein